MKEPITYDPEFVRPLRRAENQFLQVLVTEFVLKFRGRGLNLQIAFDPDSPAIWLRDAKRHLLQSLPPKRREALQGVFDKFFDAGRGVLEHQDLSFPFRFGNGGTLPVVRIEREDYYCLFFRDTHPVGWNIANGGANNLSDLLRPDAIIERELREELIIVEPERRRRYVFDWHDAHLRDHPDFALANRLWMERFRRQNFQEFEEIPLPLKWLPAFDESHDDSNGPEYDAVWVSYDNQPAIHTGRGFLNINAEDFGIEFDRIAKMAVGPDAVFCDGEIVNGKLLNRVVGLFNIEKLHERLDDPIAEFEPDRLFWDGQDRSGSDVKKTVDAYLERLAFEQLSSQVIKESKGATKLRLCPVTRNIIRRYLRTVETDRPSDIKSQEGTSFNIFLSFASEDRQLARQVYNFLNVPGRQQVFFSDVTMDHGPFARQIDRALDDSWALVAVASQLDRFNKSWVQYEWETFHNDILSGRKHQNTPFVAFTIDIDPRDLPRPFRRNTAVNCKQGAMSEELQRLSQLLQKP